MKRKQTLGPVRSFPFSIINPPRLPFIPHLTYTGICCYYYSLLITATTKPLLARTSHVSLHALYTNFLPRSHIHTSFSLSHLFIFFSHLLKFLLSLLPYTRTCLIPNWNFLCYTVDGVWCCRSSCVHSFIYYFQGGLNKSGFKN